MIPKLEEMQKSKYNLTLIQIEMLSQKTKMVSGKNKTARPYSILALGLLKSSGTVTNQRLMNNSTALKHSEKVKSKNTNNENSMQEENIVQDVSERVNKDKNQKFLGFNSVSMKQQLQN